MEKTYDPAVVRERIRLTRSLMDHPAWRLLTEDWKNEIEVHKHNLVYTPVKEDEVRGWWRGQLNVLERLVNLHKTLDAMEQGLEQEADQQDSEA